MTMRQQKLFSQHLNGKRLIAMNILRKQISERAQIHISTFTTMFVHIRPWRTRLRQNLKTCTEKNRHGIYEKPHVHNANPNKFFCDHFSRFSKRRLYRSILKTQSFQWIQRETELFFDKKVRKAKPIHFGPSDWIRTSGLLNPIQARYQTSPHPEMLFTYRLAQDSTLYKNLQPLFFEIRKNFFERKHPL